MPLGIRPSSSRSEQQHDSGKLLQWERALDAALAQAYAVRATAIALMAGQRTRKIDSEPGGTQPRGRHESGTRRILRDTPATQPEPVVDPWDSDPPPSLLSVASWLVGSVRGVPESKPVEPSISVAEAHLSAEELAAVEGDEAVRPAGDEAAVEVVEHVLTFDEAEAIDDFDLAPLRQSFERGDHLGLLAAAEALLELRPSMGAALPYLAAARESLRRRYMSELGGQQEVPRRLPQRSEGPPAAIGRDEAFMLSLIDGESTLEEIVDRSQLPQTRALQLVDRLCALGVVATGARHARYC